MLNFIDYNSENKYESGIYCITNIIDNRIYIGSTQCFKRRFSEHSRSFSDNTHNNPHLQKFVNKYGIDSIKFYIVQITDINDLLTKEQCYLDNYIDFNKDFNICKIAGTPPNYNRQFTEKDIKYIAELYNSGMSCCKISELLFNNRNKRKIISDITRGESYSEYKNLFNYRKYNQTGRVISQETKDKISKANKGNPNTGGKGKERNSNGKLDNSIVLYIRNNPDNISQSKLALKFNISKSLVKDIQKLRTYKKVK